MTTESGERELDAPRPRSHRALAVCFVIVAMLGAVHTVAIQYNVYPDTIPYLDLSDFVLSGEMSELVHGYWSPLYPVLLAAARLVAQATPVTELAVAHWLHYLIYLGAFGTYVYFVSGLRGRVSRAAGDARVVQSGMLAVFATAIFLWCTLVLTDLLFLTPDLLAAMLLFAVASIVVRLDRIRVEPVAMLTLGVLLGLAYLAKTALLPFGIPFLAAAALDARAWRTRAVRLALSLLTLALIAGPYVLALSSEKGRVTIGDSGRLNFAWFMNDVRSITHWQGGPPGSGTPVHPTRLLPGAIEAYEFATPIRGTYPAWFDASYWYEGVVVRLAPLRLVRRSVQNLSFYLALLIPAIIAAIVMVRLTGVRASIEDVRYTWPIWVATLPALAGYSMLSLETRYVGAFIALLVLALLAPLRDVPAGGRRTVGSAILLALAVAYAFPILSPTLARLAPAARSLRVGPTVSDDIAIASALGARGVPPNTAFASVGPALNGYWARVARGRIIAEVPLAAVQRYWSSPTETRERLLDEMSARGVGVAVASAVPPWADTGGWEPLARGTFVRFLSERPAAAR